MIEYIDRQRSMGTVAHRSSPDDDVRVVITRYGLKVTDKEFVVRSIARALS